MDDYVHVESTTKTELPASESIPKEDKSLEYGLAKAPIPETLKKHPQDQNAKKVENPESGLAFLDAHPFVRASVIDKTYGCIIGSALGDTIGLYTEFLPKHACDTVYPSRKFSLVEPVTEYYADSHRVRFEPRAWTDDTDQALLILLSFIQNSSNIDTIPQDFAHRLQIWISHGLRALDRPPCGIGALVGSVVSSPSYVEDPAGKAIATWIKSARHAAPNGSLMRTHPIGVIGIGLSEDQTWKLATEVGMTTHADPRCAVSVCIVVSLLRGLLLGSVLHEADIDAAIERAYTHVHTTPSLINPSLSPDLTPYETAQQLDRKEFDRHVYTQSFEALQLDDSRTMGYVYKCLGSAILCLRLAIRDVAGSTLPKQTLFEGVMTDLIMEGGDADTNGAVAGSLLGAYLGYGYLPAHWATGLAHRSWLDSKILRLCKVLGVLEGEVAEEEDEKPDAGKGLMSKKELDERDRAMFMSIMERKRILVETKRKRGKAKGFAAWFSN